MPQDYSGTPPDKYAGAVCAILSTTRRAVKIDQDDRWDGWRWWRPGQLRPSQPRLAGIENSRTRSGQRYPLASKTSSANHIVGYSLAVSDPMTARRGICLNTNVKKEAQIIQEMLQSIAPHARPWVIADADPGELHERRRRNFGHNRPGAPALAKGHREYIFR